MGYTHYWYKEKELDSQKWSDFTKDTTAIINETTELCWESDQLDRKPEITDEIIRFNGKSDGGHETFYFTRVEIEKDKAFVATDEDGKYFNFCKTARKPYDKYVVAILHLAKRHFGDKIYLASDGKDSELKEGIELIEKTFSGD